MTSDARVRVTLAEAELLAVARALVTPDGHATIQGTLGDAVRVTKLGPPAMAVLKSTLAKGVVKMLARLGGARPRSRPGVTGGRSARVFEVRPAPALAFGPYTFELVRWLTATPLHVKEPGSFGLSPETLGDEVMAYLALRLVAGGRFERVVAAAPALRSPLAWLGFARPLARWARDAPEPSLGGLLASEDRRTVVECLAGDLAQRWAASSAWDTTDLLEPAHAAKVGTIERAVTTGFLDEVGRYDRWDLATFLVEAGTRVLPPGAIAREVAARAAPPVAAKGTLRARTESRQRAGALFQALVRLGKKYEALALVRFIDDDYEAAQQILTSWEVFGREGFARAQAALSALESLDPPTVEPAATAG